MANDSEWVMSIDLGNKLSDVCRLNPTTGESEFSRVAMTPEKLRQHFKDMKPCKVIVEAGAQSWWFTRDLKSLGFEVVVTDPRRNALISKSMSKSDRKDALLLAHLLVSSPRLLHPIIQRRIDAVFDLAVIRARDVAVRVRTTLMNTARGMSKSVGLPLDAGSPGTLSKAKLDPRMVPALQFLLDEIGSLTKTIAAYDRQIKELIKARYPEAQALMKIKGVGPVTALAFILTIDDPKRFKNGRMVGAYFGLRPKQFESGDIRKQLGITKAGDGLVRRLLVQCAHYILGPFGEDCDLRRWGNILALRGGKNAKKRACVAVARKLAAVLFRLWVDQSEYQPLRKEPKSSAA